MRACVALCLALASAIVPAMSRPASADQTYVDSKWPQDLLSLSDVKSVKHFVRPANVDDSKRPPFVPSDYAPYRGHGTGILDGAFAVDTKRATFRCVFGDVVYLVPATDYLWWLANKTMYVAETTGNPNTVQLFLASLPGWMQPLPGDDEDGIIKATGCDAATGEFSFDKIPFGSYFVLTSVSVQLTRQYQTDHVHFDPVTKVDPNTGEAYQDSDMKHDFTTTSWSDLADGFLLMEPGFSSVTAGDPLVTLDPVDFAVLAHFHARANYRTVPAIPPI